MTENVRNLLDQFDADWQTFRSAVDRLGLDRMEEATSSGWKVKQMLAHIAFWDEATFGYVTTAFRGRDLPEGWTFGSGYYPSGPWPSSNEHNAREADWASERPPQEVLQRLADAHRQAQSTLESLTEDELKAQWDYFHGLSHHYTEHLREVKTLLGEAMD